MEGKLVIISAPSGAGKSTIVNYLLKSGLHLEFSVSATTRQPRGGEKNGKEYYFISTGEFRKKIADNEFIEWEEVYKDHYYGTLKNEIERIWTKGNIVLFDVDVKGGINLKRLFGTKAISIFVMPPSITDLEKRLLTRGTDDISKIKIRLAKADEEIRLANMFDKIVINDNLETAQKETYTLVADFVEKK